MQKEETLAFVVIPGPQITYRSRAPYYGFLIYLLKKVA